MVKQSANFGYPSTVHGIVCAVGSVIGVTNVKVTNSVLEPHAIDITVDINGLVAHPEVLDEIWNKINSSVAAGIKVALRDNWL